jgi:hypothetical protein
MPDDNVPKKPAASILSSVNKNLKMEAADLFETLVSIYQLNINISQDP